MRRRALKEALEALEAAESVAEWRVAAEAMDQLTGALEWRHEESSPYYDASLLKSELLEIRRLRQGQEGLQLAEVLTASLYRHLADIAAPELYAVALAGTKRLISEWLEEVEAALLYLAGAPLLGISESQKKARFQQAAQVFGCSALLLSGGATWGFHHLGVVKALFEHGLLPDILSGASTGAMIAGGICTRNQLELKALFEDPSVLRLDGLKSSEQIWRDRAWLDPEQLYAVLSHNIGPSTFAEAFFHSRRVLSIAVSPTRTRQKPRLLSYLTSPDVLVARAALASSALPGLFPPVVLEARTAAGELLPYQPNERWVDGSIYEDLPKLRLARLFNVNHFIVSQTNPHVVPFARHRGQRGITPALAAVVSSSARTQGAFAAELAMRATRPGTGPVRQLADRAYALISQDYHGDIDIHPEFHWSLLTKIVANPTPKDLTEFIRSGERSTWPKLAMIADQTRLGRVFQLCLSIIQSEKGLDTA
jgi:NTE family protein